MDSPATFGAFHRAHNEATDDTELIKMRKFQAPLGITGGQAD